MGSSTRFVSHIPPTFTTIHATMSGSSQLDAQVLACLQATLNPDEGTRRAAEEQLLQLYQHPGKSQLHTDLSKTI